MLGRDPTARAHALEPPVPELPLRKQGGAAVLATLEVVTAAREPGAVAQAFLLVLKELLPDALGAAAASTAGRPLAAVDVAPRMLAQLVDVPAAGSGGSVCQALAEIGMSAAARATLESAGCRSLLLLPLVTGDDRLGAVSVLLAAPYRLSPLLAETLDAIAGSAAMALVAAFERQDAVAHDDLLTAELAAVRAALADERRVRRQAEAQVREAQERLGRRNGVDSVTGLTSGRHFHAMLEVEVQRSRRYGDELGLLLIDIDEFKCYNDAYGHAQGDRVLARLGLMLQQELRKVDTAFRYGGEEFAVILPRCGQDALLNLAERLRERFAAEPLHNGERVSRLSISIGAAVYRRAAPVESFVRHADRALYRAKVGGRNRVVLA